MGLPNEIPKVDREAAVKQFWEVGRQYFWGLILTYLGAGLLVVLTAKRQTRHPLNKPLSATHSQRYVDAGASGCWEYFNSNVPWLKSWNNLEDGLLGEPSGKHSARVKGKERSKWSMLKWTFRNPYNYAKRTDPRFFCPVNDCYVTHFGDMRVSDKAPVQEGWYLVKAVHKVTGRVYYGYRSVRLLKSGKVRQVNLGFKLKPEHAFVVQDDDDLDKAYTVRIQFASTPD